MLCLYQGLIIFHTLLDKNYFPILCFVDDLNIGEKIETVSKNSIIGNDRSVINKYTGHGRYNY